MGSELVLFSTLTCSTDALQPLSDDPVGVYVNSASSLSTVCSCVPSRACDHLWKYIFQACQSAFSHQRLMTEEVTSDNHSAWFRKSKRRWPCLSANRGGENGHVSPVNVLFFKPRWLLLLSQAHNFMPLKVPRGKE